MEEEDPTGGGGSTVPRILISPSSPDQNQQLYTTAQQSRSQPQRSPAKPSRLSNSPRIPGSLALESPSNSSTASSPPTSTSAFPSSTASRTISQSQSFFSSLATTSTTMLTSSISSLMLLPSKVINVGTSGGIKLTKISSSNARERRPSQVESQETTNTYREEGSDESLSESESESESGESRQGEEESQTETESEDEGREYGVGSMGDSRAGGGEIGRQSMDLRLEEAVIGPSSVLDTPSISSPATALESEETSSTIPPQLHRTPSTAFKQASISSSVHPLTLQAISRQESEREALRVVEEMGAVFKRRDTIEGNVNNDNEGDVGNFLGRVRSESPTQLDEERNGGAREREAVERGREDSQSTIKDQSTSTPRSVSMIGNGLPSNVASSTRMQDRSVSGVSTTESTKTKKSFFARFKKDKNKSSIGSSKDLESNPSSTSTTGSVKGGGGGGKGSEGVRRSGSLMSGASSKRNRSNSHLPPPSARSSVFAGSEVGEGSGGTTSGKAGKVRHPKVRTKGKSRKDFNKLFLAQELHLTSPFPSPITVTGNTTSESPTATDSASLHSLPRGPEDSPTSLLNNSTEPPLPQSNDTKKDKTSSGSSSTPGKSASKQSRAVWAIKFSNNGKWLAVGGRDGIVRVWEVLSSKEERETLSTQAAGGGHGGAMPIFKEKPIREYKGHTSDVLDLNWSKNDFLLSSSMDKTVRLWHIDRDECLCSFEHLDFVTSIAFHPKDDRFFLSGSLDCKLRLWNIVEKRVQVWTELPELITAVAFSRDGSLCMAGSFVGTCMFFEVETFRFHNIFTAKSSKRKAEQKGKKITSLCTFPLGAFNSEDSMTTDDDALGRKISRQAAEEYDRLLVTSNDSHVRLYNTKGKFIEAKYSGHENTSSQIRASFSDDGKYIISGSEDRHVYIWDSGIARNSFGDFDVLKKRTEGSGFETFSMSAHIVTAAIFAPTTTRSHLAKSNDPIFSNGEVYPHLDPLPKLNTKSSLGGMSEKSERDKKGASMASREAEDMIIVVADAETGVISVFRNSKLPNSILSPSAPTSAAGSIFRHNNASSQQYQQQSSSSTSMKDSPATKRWSRASATSH